jgi:hypothetical protein
MGGLKALDPNRPIREADMCGATRDVRFGPIADIGLTIQSLLRRERKRSRPAKKSYVIL